MKSPFQTIPMLTTIFSFPVCLPTCYLWQGCTFTMEAHVCHRSQRVLRGSHSLLLLCGSFYSECQCWSQVSLPTEPPHWSPSLVFGPLSSFWLLCGPERTTWLAPHLLEYLSLVFLETFLLGHISLPYIINNSSDYSSQDSKQAWKHIFPALEKLTAPLVAINCA